MIVWLAHFFSVDDYILYGIFSTRAKAVEAMGRDPDIQKDDPKSYFSHVIEEVKIDKANPNGRMRL